MQARLEPAAAAKLMHRATMAAVGAALLLVALKSMALYLTGSVAMLGTLFDSVLDGAASLINLFAVRHALTPADDEHRFGHGKAEALSGLAQSFLILGSAAFIAFQAFNRLLHKAPVENSAIGMIVIVVAIGITLALVAYQRHVVERTGSTAIAADSLHYRGDLLMNLAALVALALSAFFGLHWADPILGMVIAALIAYGAWRIVIVSGNQLMDHELSEQEREKIKRIALAHKDVLDIHDLRTRRSGVHTFVQFHMELAMDISLVEANAISHEVESDIVREFPGAEVIIHGDPVAA